MASPKTLEQVRAAREKRQGVFEKARAMRQAGQISEADFTLLEKKFQQKMAVLDAAEAEILAAQGPPEPSLDDSSAEEVLGLAKEILGTGEPAVVEPGAATEAATPDGEGAAPDALVGIAAAPTDPGPEGLDLALAGGPTPEVAPEPSPEPEAALEPEAEPDAPIEPEAASEADAALEPDALVEPEPEPDPDLEATMPDLGRLGPGADEEDGSADATDPDGHPPLTGSLIGKPAVAVDELSAMFGAAEMETEGGDDDGATPAMSFPAVDAAGSLLGPAEATGSGGDSDLLSLVRGSFSSEQDSRPDTESRLRAEQRAREEAVARAKSKEEEAAEMHEAFRRTVKEKDSLGAKLVAARREGDRMRKGAFGGLAGLVVVMGICLFLNQARQTAVTEANEARDKLTARETERAKLVTRAERAEEQAGQSQREVDKLKGQIRTTLSSLKTKLDASEARVAELEEQLEGVPEGGGALVPDARLEPVLLQLLHLRARQPGSDEEEFLESISSEVPEARAAVEELARRRQVDGGMLDDPLVDALELALAGNLRAAAAPMNVLLSREDEEAAGTRRALAAVRLELGDGAGAAALLEGVSGDGEGAVESRRLLAAAYRRARRFDDARRILQLVLASPLATHDDYLQAGMVAEMTEDAVAAEAAYRHVVEADPENARAISLLSSLAIQRADWAGAASLLAKAVTANPGDDALRYNLALARLGLGENDAATPLVEELLRNRWPGAEELAAKLGLDPAAYVPEPEPEPVAPEDAVEAGGAGGDDLPDMGGGELPGTGGGDLPGGDELPGAGGALPGSGGGLPGDGGGLPGMGDGGFGDDFEDEDEEDEEDEDEDDEDDEDDVGLPGLGG